MNWLMNAVFPPINQCPLRYHSLFQPEQPALLLDQQPVSYQQLDRLVEQCRQKLAHQNMGKERHLAVIARNPVDTLIFALACLREKIVFCPVNPAFPEQQRQQYYQRINTTLVVESSGVSMGEEPVKIKSLEPVFIDPESIMSLIATSGTSGTPKAVAHSYSNHYFNAVGSHHQMPLSSGDHWLLSLPLFHVGGFAIIIRCLLAGATMVVETEKGSLEQVLMSTPVTHLSLVNTQLYRLLSQGLNLYELGVRTILLGGGIASPDLVNKALSQGLRLLTTYGMTEMASQVCTGHPRFNDRGVTSGELLPGRDLTLSASGEIWVRGKPLAMGYYQQGSLIPLVDKEGWYHTGDQGAWYQGQLQVMGRIDNMFISGGENIHPEEVERALAALPGVIQSVVVPVTSQEFGQRPVAYVETVDGTVDESFTKRHLAGKIAKFKVPDRILPFPEDMVHTGIKVNRRFFQQRVQNKDY